MRQLIRRVDLTRKQFLGLGAVVFATLVAYISNLDVNEYGNSYYAAAVQAGSRSFKAALFGALDFGNGASIDKSPLSLWPMELSVKLFGFNSFALFFPQVLMGVATMLILFFSVRKSFGYAAGILTAVVFATTPVVSIMYRYDNPDAATVLLITAAIAATLRLNRTGRGRWAVVVGVCLGLAFLAKLLLGVILLPVLALLYVLFGTGTWRYRLLQLPYALIAFVLSCGWWFLIVILTPASDRPYLAGTNDNSIWSLIIGYNGVGRLTGYEYEGKSVITNSTAFAPAGIFRLFGPHAAAQASWLLPLGIVAGLLALYLFRRVRRTDIRFFESAVWLGSILFIAVIISLMQGIFHVYYTLAIAPGVAALAGVTLHLLKDGDRHTWVRIVLGVALAGTGVWSGIIMTFNPDFGAIFLAPVIGGVAAGLLAILGLPQSPRAEYQHLFYITLVLSLLLGPGVYSADTIFTKITGADPIAGPNISSPVGPAKIYGMNPNKNGVNSGSDQPLVNGTPDPLRVPDKQSTNIGLSAGDQSRKLGLYMADGVNYRWAAAVFRGDNAADLQVTTGLSILDLGGYAGRDPYPSLQEFQRAVKQKKIRYFIEDTPLTGLFHNMAITKWVRENYYYSTSSHWIVYDLSRPISR